MNKTGKTSAILLAGGLGTRMQSAVAKQFLPLGDKPVALHSFSLFLEIPQIDELIVVCAEEYRPLFADFSKTSKKPMQFAEPGPRRQDSAYNGLLAASSESTLICIHDAARPFINSTLVCQLLEAAQQHGAAAPAIPLKFTIKERCSENMVIRTPDRTRFCEIQTPQAIKKEILLAGYRHVHAHGITATDDVQLAELAGYPVKLVDGSETNIKLTTPFDLLLATQFLEANGALLL
jgi:2-C-methyl-D-erythritol 4-phosphate cytidylyltransferase